MYNAGARMVPAQPRNTHPLACVMHMTIHDDALVHSHMYDDTQTNTQAVRYQHTTTITSRGPPLPPGTPLQRHNSNTSVYGFMSASPKRATLTGGGLSGGGGGGKGGLGGSKGPLQRFDFCVQSNVGPGVFARTKVITLTPRYVMVNNLEETLEYGQRGVKVTWRLAPGGRAPFYWDDTNAKYEGRFQV